MVQNLLDKVFRKDAKRVGTITESIVSRPMTATEKTVARINEYRRSEGLDPL